MATDSKQTRPTVICGPSGVGKRTLIKKLQNTFPSSFEVAVSHTTRKRRDDESPNIDYYFITKEQFEKDMNDNLFIEYSLYDSEYYGTSYKAIESMEDNLICLLEIDCNGASKIKKDNKIECNYLFITTSDGIDTLKERMISRNTENMDQIERRLEIGKKELEFLNENPNFFDAVIYNDKDIDETIHILTEQFLIWYPDLKEKMENTEDTKEDIEDEDEVGTLANIMGGGSNRINRISKRQSLDLYADFHHKAGNELFTTNESLCREVLNSDLSPFQHNDHIIGIIIEFTDISPRNRKKQWENINEFSVIINKLKLSVEHRWTIGNNIDHYPEMNMNTINEIYFAYHEQIINGYLFYLCGTVKCPKFVKLKYE